MTVIACRMCGEQKPTEAFHRNSAAPGGRRLEHVEDNLQLLFAEDNIRKKNSIPNGGGLSL